MADTLNTEYDDVHKKYHPSIKGFLEEFGYYDIFLVDTSGNIVYSVFKELDYDKFKHWPLFIHRYRQGI